MHVFEFVLVIVAICMIGGVLKSYFNRRNPGDLKEKLYALLGEMDFDMDYYSKKKLDPYLKKIEAMEQRIQNLEKIATDPRRNLADAIDNLK